MSTALIVTVCSAVLTLCACSKQEPAKPVDDAMMAMTTLEGELSILARPGRVEQGQNDTKFDWVSAFEAETACKVTVKTAASAEELLGLATDGGPRPSPPGDASWPPPGNAPFDLVIASGDIALRLVSLRAVFPIDVGRVPSYDAIEPALQKAAWHYVNGQHYGVPYQWSPNVLLYDTTVFKQPPASWAVTFVEQKLPDGKSNRGRVQAHGTPIYIADAALHLKAQRPELGIEDPYELSEAQYQAALELLRAQRPLVQRYWQDADQQVQDFRNEGVVVSGSWPLQANTLLANKAKVATAIPNEGATGWGEATMLITGARHPNCAYKWLEWSLSARVQGDVAAFVGSNPVVPKACENNALLGPEGCRANGIESLGQVALWRTPAGKCAAHVEGCVPYSRWVADFEQIMAGK